MMFVCHQTFAMSGALAWQVRTLMKIPSFWFLGQIARGAFARDLAPVLCHLFYLSLVFYCYFTLLCFV